MSRSFWWTASSRCAGTARRTTRRSNTLSKEVGLLAARRPARPRSPRAPRPRRRPCASARSRRRRSTSWRWLLSRPSAMRRRAASFSTTGRRYGSSAPPVLVRLLGPTPLVVAGQRSEHLDLLGREAGQVAVRDQVVRVLLVLGVADIAADVVEKRAVLQPLALGCRKLVEGVRLVEELERQPRHVGRMEHLRVASPQEAVDAAGPHVPVESTPLALAGHVVEEDPLPQPAVAHDDRLGPVRFRIQASRRPPGTAMSRRRGSSPGTLSFSFSVVFAEEPVDLLQPLPRQRPVAGGRGLPAAHGRLVDERQRLDRARRADAGLEADPAHGRCGPLGRGADRLLHVALVSGSRRIVARESVGQAHDAQREGSPSGGLGCRSRSRTPSSRRRCPRGRAGRGSLETRCARRG